MSSIDNDLQDFNRFAREHVSKEGPAQTIDELFDQWRTENPPEEDLLAIQASLRDADAGERGKPIGDHIDEMRQKHNIT